VINLDKTLSAILDEGRLTLSSSVKNKVNKALRQITNDGNKTRYLTDIPMNQIINILKKNGLILLQEDGTPWGGILTGRSSQADFEVGDASSNGGYGTYAKYTNSMLRMSWHKMTSGKWEIIAYLT